MRIETLAVTVGVGAPLILMAPSDAGFMGMFATVKPNDFGLMTVNVYAEFDNPGNDWMQAVAGTPDAPLSIVALGGPFYNHEFGDDSAPDEFMVTAFPSLAFDSFYTIGLKAVPTGGTDQLSLVNMPPLEGTSVNTANGAWGVLAPPAPQGNPFDPVNSFPGNGTILIGQFSMEEAPGTFNWGITGQFLLQYVSDGVVGQSYRSFEVISHGNCEFNEECNDLDPCNGEEICVDFLCQTVPPVPDCNGNGRLDSCDIADGTSTDANGNGVPDDCDVLCAGDLDGDGDVGVADFLELLANWGPCP